MSEKITLESVVHSGKFVNVEVGGAKMAANIDYFPEAKDWKAGDTVEVEKKINGANTYLNKPKPKFGGGGFSPKVKSDWEKWETAMHMAVQSFPNTAVVDVEAIKRRTTELYNFIKENAK